MLYIYVYIYTLAYIYAHKRARIPPQISCCDIEGNFFWRMGPYPINCTVFGIWPNLVAYLPHFQITHSVYRFWLKSFMNSQVTSMFVPSISSVLSILQYIVYMDLYPTHKPTSGKRTKPIHTHIYIDRNRYKDKYQHKYRYIQIISRVKPPPSSKKNKATSSPAAWCASSFAAWPPAVHRASVTWACGCKTRAQWRCGSTGAWSQGEGLVGRKLRKTFWLRVC